MAKAHSEHRGLSTHCRGGLSKYDHEGNRNPDSEVPVQSKIFISNSFFDVDLSGVLTVNSVIYYEFLTISNMPKSRC